MQPEQLGRSILSFQRLPDTRGHRGVHSVAISLRRCSRWPAHAPMICSCTGGDSPYHTSPGQRRVWQAHPATSTFLQLVCSFHSPHIIFSHRESSSYAAARRHLTCPRKKTRSTHSRNISSASGRSLLAQGSAELSRLSETREQILSPRLRYKAAAPSVNQQWFAFH